MDDTKSRPTITRTDSKVRFCLDNNICFEVPRPTKDMKPDLFYTKREIKTFKAEKKEEKRELKQQKKLEKQKAKEAAAEGEKDKEDSSDEKEDEDDSAIAVGPTPIATC